MFVLSGFFFHSLEGIHRDVMYDIQIIISYSVLKFSHVSTCLVCKAVVRGCQETQKRECDL
jgi:hypothetical protein